MEIDPQEISRVWWRGAMNGTAKGAVQGLIIGFTAACILFGLAVAFPVLTAPLFTGLGTFLFGGTVAHPLFAPFAMVAVNGVVGAVSGFMNSGNIAVNAYKQDVEHKMNEARIGMLEAREMAIEQTVAPSRTVKQLLSDGPRQKDSFADAEKTRVADGSKTVH